ncbi:hypothetical protein TruAng_009751 [Truncatella angustata]|nr:hypothetical protein TruAng_009751 [Truncatella angustata]
MPEARDVAVAVDLDRGDHLAIPAQDEALRVNDALFRDLRMQEVDDGPKVVRPEVLRLHGQPARVQVSVARHWTYPLRRVCPVARLAGRGAIARLMAAAALLGAFLVAHQAQARGPGVFAI